MQAAAVEAGERRGGSQKQHPSVLQEKPVHDISLTFPPPHCKGLRAAENCALDSAVCMGIVLSELWRCCETELGLSPPSSLQRWHWGSPRGRGVKTQSGQDGITSRFVHQEFLSLLNMNFYNTDQDQHQFTNWFSSHGFRSSKCTFVPMNFQMLSIFFAVISRKFTTSSAFPIKLSLWSFLATLAYGHRSNHKK